MCVYVDHTWNVSTAVSSISTTPCLNHGGVWPRVCQNTHPALSSSKNPPKQIHTCASFSIFTLEAVKTAKQNACRRFEPGFCSVIGRSCPILAYSSASQTTLACHGSNRCCSLLILKVTKTTRFRLSSLLLQW